MSHCRERHDEFLSIRCLDTIDLAFKHIANRNKLLCVGSLTKDYIMHVLESDLDQFQMLIFKFIIGKYQQATS